jgi:aminoglycoside phosphotransferase (APT) family kinase protein
MGRVIGPTDAPRGRAVQALAAHDPAFRNIALRPLGAGVDHAAFVAGDLVVRAAIGPQSDVAREAELLRLLTGRLPVAVPEPRIVDPELGVIAYRLLPGRSLLGRPPPGGAAQHLGHVLRALHAISAAKVDGIVPLDPADPQDWLDELTGPTALLRLLATTKPRPTTVLVPAHADLGAEHILESDGAISGIVDWSDAAITDPALDFARLYRDFGQAFLDDALIAYGRDSSDLRERITFFARCAALEDLTYGQASGRSAYRRNAEYAISWLFP